MTVSRTYGVGIVSYASLPDAVRTVESVLAQSLPPAELVVVENHGGEAAWDAWRGALGRWGTPVRARVGGLEGVIEAFAVAVPGGPEVTVLRSARNGGFCAGHNVALAATRAPAYLSLNPDCVLLPQAAEVLLAGLRPGAGVASGVLLGPQGGVDARAGIVSRVTGRTRVVRTAAEAAHRPERALRTYTGACAMFERAALDAVGGFPEDFFLYYDEAALSLALGRAGSPPVLLPVPVGVHGRHSTTRPAGGGPSTIEAYHAARSSMLLARLLGPAAVVSFSAARAVWTLRLLLVSRAAAGANLRGLRDGAHGRLQVVA